jgi:hypothetical protein
MWVWEEINTYAHWKFGTRMKSIKLNISVYMEELFWTDLKEIKILLSSEMQRWVFQWKLTDFPKKHVNSIFRSEELSQARSQDEAGDMFPRNVGWISPDYTALYTITQTTS